MESQVAPPEGDKNTGPTLEAVPGLFLSISLVLVSLRIYVRARMLKNLWWDDYFLLFGLFFSIAVFGLAIASIHSGFGRHGYYLSPKQTVSALKLDVIALAGFIFSLMFTKISICLFLLRIFMISRVWNSRKWKRAMYIIMALIVVTNLSAILVVFFRCNPVAKLWNSTIKGTCWSEETQNAIYYYQGGVSIFTDFLLAFLPIYFLKNIQISFRIKLSICALMSLGLFTGICAINRTASNAKPHLSDVTYLSESLHIWAALEMHVAIIAAAIPALRPLWAKTANQNQKNGGKDRRPDNEQRQNSTYFIMVQQMEAGSLPSRLETCITAQGGQNQGDEWGEASSLPDCDGIVKTSHVGMESCRKRDGEQWIRENSRLSDEERRVEDVV